MATIDDYGDEVRSLLGRAGDAIFLEFAGVDPEMFDRAPEVLYDIGDFIGVDYRAALQEASDRLRRWGSP